MSAKEMFEQLGYELTNNEYPEIRYMQKDYCISFYLDDKCIECYHNDFYTTSCSIELEELQAINKQIEELGWDND